MTEEVTMKDTKKTILNAYEDALEEINALKSQQFNPAELRTQELNEEAVEHASTMSWDLDSVFATMRRSIDNNLRSMQQDLESEKEELNKVRRAKEALAAELQSLYGISAEANSLAALMQSQKAKKEDHDAYIRSRREELDVDWATHVETMANERLVWDQEKSRKNQEWEYNFRRECKQKEDSAHDAIQQSKKQWLTELEKQNKELAERREAVAKQEKELIDLKAQVDEFPARLEAAEAEARKKAQQSYGIEVNALKRNHEADMKVIEHHAKSLEQIKDELTAKVASLEADMKAAYGNIQGVASKALEAQGNATIVAEVQRAAASASASKGK